MTDITCFKKDILRIFLLIVIIIIFTLGVLFLLSYFNLIPKKYYSASDFNIDVVYSDIDFNNNGNDDYSDFVIGARKDATNHPKYVSKYYEGGYPPDDEGVCTDVIWRAFKEAGYSLKDMVDLDISENLEDYDIEVADPNIDFRRVKNLNVYFKKYGISLTTDVYDIESWQAGDIVVFKNSHIGLISDRRNKDGIPYVIHNANQLFREEDYLTKGDVLAHYRFDASLIDSKYLREWSEEDE